MEKNDYLYIFNNRICKNKRIFLPSLITAILCFGFAVVNHSIGVDDPLRDHYLYSNGTGSMIQQGRILHIILNGFLGIVDFIPFFNEFLGAGLFFFSALFFAALFQYISHCRCTDLSLATFCCIYISYSIISAKFVYSLDVIATTLSYCCTALSLVFAYQFSEENSIFCFIKAVVLMALAAGSYESFLFLYFCGVFAIFILQTIFSDSKVTFRSLLFSGLKYALVLVCAAVIYYGTVYLVQIISGQYDIWERKTPWDNDDGFLFNFKKITLTILEGLKRFSCLPVFEFVIVSIIGVVFFIYKSIRKKSLLLLLCFGAFWAGNLFIHYVIGSLMLRAAQTFCFFVAFVVFLIIAEAESTGLLKKIGAIFVIYLVLVQAADMNREFYNDYKRYKKESFAVNTIATQLVGSCDVSKPVVFIGVPQNGYLNNHGGPSGTVNGSSMVYWGVQAFGVGKMHDIFHAYGYDFLKKPANEDMARAREMALEMEVWPSDGSIEEFDAFIIVKMGE